VSTSESGFETERLRLVPYDPRWLLALIDSADRFQAVSGLSPAPGLRDFFVSGEVSAGFLESLRRARGADPWVHGFAAVHRDSDTVIGGGGFKGPPDAGGVVEIAYAIVPGYEGRGYATEVAAGLLRFASADARVSTLRAHTLPQHGASSRVLTKVGFGLAGEVVDPEDGPVWRWERGRCDSVAAATGGSTREA
jgi:[ribosomal protein S5]-alanine N-acetyltransferase